MCGYYVEYGNSETAGVQRVTTNPCLIVEAL